MFLAFSKLKKNIERAYKSKVTIGCINEGIVISDGASIVWVNSVTAPNELKALVVQYLGYIPKDGQVYEVGKDIPAQVVLEDSFANIFKKYKNEADTLLKATPLIISAYGNRRIMQNENTGEIMLIDEGYFQVIDKTVIDFGNETEPDGPLTIQGIEPNANGLYWANEECIYIVMPLQKNEENDFYTVMKKIDFTVKL